MLFGNLHWPFIKRSKISHIIERQCERERNYMEKKNKAEIEHVVKTMTQSHLLDIQEKDAEIASLKDHLERQQTRVQGAESIYLQAIHMQKQARRIATDIALQAEEATNLSIKFHQSMLQMCQSAENHEKEALSGFGENTKLLRGGK